MVSVVRQRLHSAAIRLRSAWLQILQTAVAACVAWSLAVLILGQERPTFAPIAAVIALGLAVGRSCPRMRTARDQATQAATAVWRICSHALLRRVAAECRRWRPTETMISTHRQFPGSILPISII